jgi:hypothetical protein
VRPSAAWLLASSLMVVALSSCGEGPGSSDSAMSGRTAAGGSDPGATVPESVPAYPFELVNPRVYAVIVYASAGAGEVLLDTVAAGDSVRIEVRVGSDPLKLRAVDLDGNELGSEYLDLPDMAITSSPPDSSAPIRWELPPSP